MGYLYGELSDSEEAAFRAELERDPELEAELDSLERTRKAFGQLADEEPPPAISAQLLHEAAKRAPAKMRAQTIEGAPGFWERVRAWFDPLLAQPAIASVAALLLVGGAAGLFYMRGIDGGVHPTAPTTAPAPSSTPAAVAAAPSPDPARGAIADETIAAPGYFANTDKLTVEGVADDGLRKQDGESFEARLAAPEQEQALRELEATAKPSAERKEYRAAPKKAERIGGGKRSKSASKQLAFDGDAPMANAVSGADPLITPDQNAEGSGYDLADGRGALGGAKGTTRSTGSTTSTVTGSEQASAPPQAGGAAADTWRDANARRNDEKNKDTAVARQAPARREPMAPVSPVTSSLDSEDDDRSEAEAVAQQSSSSYRVYKDKRSDEVAKSLHGRLNLALDGKGSKKSRCQDAARIANDILDRNPAYYHAKVEDSKRLSPCRWYVAEETRSRTARRARKSSAKTKQMAAPAEADAAETTAD